MSTVFDVSVMKDRTVRIFTGPFAPDEVINVRLPYFKGEVVEIASKEGQEAAQTVVDLFGNLNSGDLVLIGNDIYNVNDNLQAVFVSTINL